MCGRPLFANPVTHVFMKVKCCEVWDEAIQAAIGYLTSTSWSWVDKNLRFKYDMPRVMHKNKAYTYITLKIMELCS